MSGSEPWRQRAKSLSRGKRSADSAKDGGDNRPDAEPALPKPTGIPPLSPAKQEAKSSEAIPDDWQPLDAASSFDPGDDATEVTDIRAIPEESNAPRISSRRRFAWLEIGVVVVVVGLLGIGVARLFQKPARVAELKRDAEAKQSESDNRASGSGSTAPRSAEKTRPAETAIDIANRMVDGAGDGSFSLDASESDVTENAPASPQELAPMVAPEPTRSEPTRSEPTRSEPTRSEPTPAAPGADSSPPDPPPQTPPERDPPAKRKFAPAPDPDSIAKVERSADQRDATQPLRPEIVLPAKSRAFVSFERVYATAFETYQDYRQQHQSDPQSDVTRELLKESVKLFQQCLARPPSEFSEEQRWQIQFTLAGLYYDAGRLYEAFVYAHEVVRRAPAEQALTTAASTVAYTALREAYERHYGDPTSPGELEQLAAFCQLMTDRGIKQPQLDAMRYGVAQLYGQDGFHLEAAQIYTTIPKKSPLYGKAQLAAGREFWAEVARREQDQVDDQKEALESNAAKYLSNGIDTLEAAEEISPTLLAGKLSLAQIALRRDAPNEVLVLLEAPKGVLGQIGKELKMSKDFVTTAHECLFQAHSMNGNLAGIQSALDSLAKQYGRSGKTRIAQLRTKVARDFLENLDPSEPITRALVAQLESTMKSVIDPKQKPSTEMILWAASVWTDLIDRAQNDAVAVECLSNADALYLRASRQRGLGEAEKMTIHLKRIDLAAKANRHEQALSLITEILRESPTAIKLQFRAADVLTEMAQKDQDIAVLGEAINGRVNESIWGWAKLTNMLAQMRFRADGEDENLDRLLESGYRLNQCRLQSAQFATSTFERVEQLEIAKKHLSQLISTFAQKSPAWKPKLESLLQEIERGI